ncbi:MAG: response regulator transcription factor [Verrucomicrobia bacterium]|nr:response regulator transcription factor [Verrucomicrobiota bacterium]
MNKVRILIADDHALVREGLRRVLETRRDWEVCAEAVNGRDAVAKACACKPDVVIVDFSMPELNGLEATRQIHAALPRTEVLVLTMHETDSLVRDVLAAGARGFILKSDAGHALVEAIETLLLHKPYFTAKVTELVLQGYLNPASAPGEISSPLTARERQVVQLVAEGKSSKEVADSLGVSAKTVESHRANILRKLGLRSSAELVRYAVRNKIVEA